MSYRRATEADVGRIVEFRLSADKAWQKGRLELRDGKPILVPRWGSCRNPVWENVRVAE